jgi:hypothetical protein
MKRTLVALLFVCCLCQPLYAAPTTNFLSSFPKETHSSVLLLDVEFDYQENEFPEQQERSVELDATGDRRIHSEIRSSTNAYNYAGIKAGFKLKHLPLFYVTAGYAEANVEFSFKDTLTEKKNTYSMDTTFDSDGFFVYGAGMNVQPLNKRINETLGFTLGIDLRYRYFDFEAKKSAGSEDTELYDMEYSSELHEIQLSIVGAVDGFSMEPVSGKKILFTPYAGVKISHFIADESFKDTGNVVITGNSFKNDPILYNGDIEVTEHLSFIAGTGIEIKKNIVIGLEARIGDEKGYSGNILFKF